MKGLAVLEEKRAALAAGNPVPQGRMAAADDSDASLRRVIMTPEGVPATQDGPADPDALQEA